MDDPYVEQREDAYFVRSSRVSLDSIVYAFRHGDSPETIRERFPTLTLDQVYGTIAYYLAHQAQIDAYVQRGEELFEQARRSQAPLPADLHARLDKAREEIARRR